MNVFTLNARSHYSLRKSRQIMKSCYKWYQKKGKTLSSDKLNFLESHLQQLDQALIEKNREKASAVAKELEQFSHNHFSRSIWDYSLEMLFALLFALLIATVVRQMWFELYEIPTGSMRPTFKEQDRLTVTKTAFGINYPLETKHLYFDPTLVQRTSVVIWSGDGIAHLDSDSTFLGIFPYTKRFIKRAMGKPGDTLYFYGGQIYGFDRDGNDLVELRHSPSLSKLDHIPFIHFEGRPAIIQEPRQNMSSKVNFNLINQLIGKYSFSRNDFKGEIFNGKEWIKDQPEAQKQDHSSIQTYSDFFGMRNYAMARLLTKDQIEAYTSISLEGVEEAPLYLELRHTPSLSYPGPILDRYGMAIAGFTTAVPLKEKQLKTLMNNMYTTRFVVKNERGDRYRQEGGQSFNSSSPSFPGVADGVYEFYYGKAYKIDWGGIATLLPADHPLYSMDPKHIQMLYNLGIEMNTEFAPHSRQQATFPNRYAYFRDGDLYVLGAPLLNSNDTILKSFNEREKIREEKGFAWQPYVAFKDYGAPVTENGELNKDFISIFGYKVPEGHYLVLGDNHAMSQDSRHFGPIPQANLQGAPSLIIWPPGERWGFPNQKPYPMINTPRLIVWGVVATILLIWYLVHRRRIRQPLFKKI